MKLNTTPRHYMPLSQSQSDDDESGPLKEDKEEKKSFKNSFVASNELIKDTGHVEIYEVDAKNLPMSSSRKFLFILSLFVCVLFVIIFVFFVPCTKHNSLSSVCHLTRLWKSVHQDISFISPLDFVHSEIPGSYIVILSYVSDESGLIAIEGPTGKERWRLALHSTPTSSICDAVDVNSDGYSECIIIGYNGLLTAVDLRKGVSLWYLHSHTNLRPVVSLDKPMLMPDCDDDNIDDLFLPYISYGDNVTYLAVVSGGTGQIIGSLLELSKCMGPVAAHFAFKMENETDFVLYCEGQETGNLWKLSSKSVCEVALNASGRLLLENVFSIPKFVRGIHFYKLSASDNHLVLILNGNEIMLLEKSAPAFQIVWKIYLKGHQHIRVLTDGQFSEGSNQLVILSNYLFHTKVMGLNLKDGKEVWTIIQEKGNITSALKLPKFFADSDGLLLKVVSSLLSFSAQAEEKNSLERNATLFLEKNSKSKTIGTITQLKENYVLVKPEKNPVVTNLNSEEIWSFCEESTCKPDVYTPNDTVLISTSDFGISVDMLAVSSTLLPTNDSVPIREEVFIKYWNLKNICYISKCAA